MVPSAAPMILLFAFFARKKRSENKPYVPVWAFASGYLIVWGLFSLVATVLQWVLEQAALLSPTMVSASPYLGGSLLIAAGAYQFTPLKNACLKHCRSPFDFIARHWRPGTWGGLGMGIRHGVFCGVQPDADPKEVEDQQAVFAGILVLYTAVEKKCYMGILLRLSGSQI